MDIKEIQGLIQRLYQPGDPRTVVGIQDQLQKIQRSPDGWPLADALLGSNDLNVRFFGALTFTIKLNSDWDSLDLDTAEQVGPRLVFWLVCAEAQNEAPMVKKKLCTALAVYYLHKEASGQQCIRQLITSLCASDYVSDEDAKNSPATEELLPKLTPPQLATLLWFSTALAEEASSKLAGQTPAVAAVSEKRMESNLPDAASLIGYTALLPPSVNSAIPAEAIACFKSWAFYAERSWSKNVANMNQLQAVLQRAIIPSEWQAADDTLEHFIDLLRDWGFMFKEPGRRALCQRILSPWGVQQMKNLTTGDEDAHSFASLLIVYGDIAVEELIAKPEQESTQHILAMMHQLLQSSGGESAIDDTILTECLEFWNVYLEQIEDAKYDSAKSMSVPASHWLDSAERHINQMVKELWAKIHFPDNFYSWDIESQKAYGDFRIEVRDLIGFSHNIVGDALLQEIARHILISLERPESLGTLRWQELEASLFCLNAVSDALQEDIEEDAVLDEVFGSSLFTHLAANMGSTVPTKVARTALDVVGSYSDFFKRHTVHLPAALNFLFASLQMPSLANTAARSISSLCGSCRATLQAELEAFFQQYERFLGWQTANEFTKGKVIGAIAAIVQALPSDDSKAAGVQRLLDFVEIDVKDALLHMANNDVENSQVAGSTAVKNLAAISQALQTSEDIPVDLEAENIAQVSYWTDGPGAAVQERIQRFMRNMLEILGNYGDVIDATCAILRSGSTETVPGPFVLPAQATIDFISLTNLSTPRIDGVLRTACTFLSSHGNHPARVKAQTTALLHHVYNLTHALADPRNDPEIAQSLVDVVGRFVPHYTTVLFQLQPTSALEELLNFSLSCIVVPEPLPKRSAVTFWTSIIRLVSQPPELQAILDDIVRHLGPTLAAAMMQQLSGKAARSELDQFTPLLMKLVTRSPQTKIWLDQALMQPDISQFGISAERKVRFLKQLAVAKSASTMKETVLAFWVECREQPTQSLRA